MPVMGNVILSSPTGSGKKMGKTASLWLKHQLEVQGEGRGCLCFALYCLIERQDERLRSNWEGSPLGRT